MEQELRELTGKIHDLIEKLDKPKKRDLWDKIPVLTTFVAGVVIAAISLYISTRFQASQQAFEIQRQNADLELKRLEFRLQTDVSRAQVRVAELEAVTKLIPQLTSTDAETRTVAREILKTVRDEGVLATAPPQSVAPQRSPQPPSQSVGPVPAPAVPAGTDLSDISIMERLAVVALTSTNPLPRRLAATEQIVAVIQRGTSPAVQARAEQVANAIITSDNPPELKSAAAKILRLVRPIATSDLQAIVQQQNIGNRSIERVVLHHTYSPSATRYRATSAVSLARFQLEQQGWRAISWHFAVAPDGTVWLGMPLDRSATHIAGLSRDNTVSVTLILNGDAEVMTPAQSSTLTLLLRSLFTKLQLNAATALKFHRDYNPNQSCPGTLVSKESVLASLR